MYVNVSLPIAKFKSFTYKVPKEFYDNIKEGVCVIVPFGKRRLSGYVVDSDIQSSYKGKILPIVGVDRDSPNISSELWKTILWSSRYYFSPLGQVLKCALPITFKDSAPSLEKVLYITQLGQDKLKEGQVKGIKQLEILNLIKDNQGSIKYAKLKGISNSISSITKTLEDKKLIQIKNERKLAERIFAINKNIILTKQQTLVYKELEDIWQYRYPSDHDINSSGVKGVYLSNFVRWDPKKQHEQMIKRYDYKTSNFNRTFDNYDYTSCYVYMDLHDKIKLYK